MKKFISILICSLLIFNSGVYVFFYWQVKYLIKKQGLIKSQNFNPSELLTKIVITTNQSKNTSEYYFIDDYEINFNGKMYDIVKRYKVDDKIILLCISDENEDKLERTFINYIENSNNDKSTLPIKTILKLLIIDGLHNLASETLSTEKIVEYTTFPTIRYNSYNCEVPTPPPLTIC